MPRLNFAGGFVIALLSGLANEFTVPHELVPVDVTALVNAHRFPPPFRFLLAFCFLESFPRFSSHHFNAFLRMAYFVHSPRSQ
jgi:hypothetical protein